MVALSSLQAVQFRPPQDLSLHKCRPRSFIKCRIAEPTGEPAPLGQKTKYMDGFFEKAFMTLFARKMEKFAAPAKKGSASIEKGWFDYDYESFVDVSKRVMQGRNRMQQQEVVREILLSMLPPGAPEQFKKLFPPTKWAAEFNAALTVPFFQWLVGPSEKISVGGEVSVDEITVGEEILATMVAVTVASMGDEEEKKRGDALVVEVEVNGEKQKSGVHIKKCRYLENSGCVGMCVNMCKIPTQDFFTNEFGLPLTMIPNFEDMSCEMVYGQVPPPFEEDPVAKQPCLADICTIANPNSSLCPKLEA
ncbi:hypothetical protein DKX38_000589 [Salix brachista]|uniref:Beta-carotene isomerase D27-like C-terminal domain-containing protein n=1 Tax=Salix brachista TaxID=2182728 RepID=A0A5N5P163_9ROSI|nr:hypothetical protein DKX38_000589 [Salix brachista]